MVNQFEVKGFMFDSAPSPKGYEQSVVTFIDILGFSDVVREHDATEINVMLDLISETAAAQNNWGGRTEILSFSDSVIRAKGCGKSVFSAALSEIIEIANAQCELALKGILIRGGMTTGNVSVSEGRVFGPGFIRAYELEAHFAGSPRIVIDTALIPELRQQRSTANREYQEEIKRIREWMIQGDDGLWFVDYLRSEYMREAPIRHAHMMKAHREMIIKKAKDIDPISRLVPKFLWLARYHNRVATKLHPSDGSIPLGRKDIPIFDQLLLPKRRAAS